MASPPTEDASLVPINDLGGSLQLGPTDPLDDARAAVGDQTTPVHKFVLTGGPCAGKTTALTRMGDFFRDKGFRVFTVPEAATSMFTNGIDLQDLSGQNQRFAFQWSILKLQMTLEDGFERFARACGKPSILLCDRGLMDGSVYMPPQEWACLVTANGMDELTLRDARYDAIFHLVTAACGAEDHYSLDNNEARSESIEMAIDVDKRTEAVWLGHPRHMMFDNSTDFEEKMERVTAAALRIVGLPCRPRKLCKFLLAQPPPPLEEFPVRAEAFDAEKIFLRRRDSVDGEAAPSVESTEGDDPAICVNSESFLEKRGRNASFVHGITTLSTYNDGKVAEITRPLSVALFAKIEEERADPARPKVRQRRVCFLWEGQAFELRTDVEPAYGTSVLHRSEGGKLSLPTFLSLDE